MGTFGRPCFAKSKHRLSEKRSFSTVSAPLTFGQGRFILSESSGEYRKIKKLTQSDSACYNTGGRCYFWRSDPLFLSRSLRQEGGGACAEKGFSAFRMYSNSAVHFLYKSALTARVDSERSMT